MGMDVYGLKPVNEAGKYFRANVWSWRPIHALCETVLNKPLPWGDNDGEGFRKEKECIELADKLESFLKKNPDERIEIESDVRVNAEGQFLRDRDVTKGESAYSTSREHVQRWIEFLRGCRGFKIL